MEAQMYSRLKFAVLNVLLTTTALHANPAQEEALTKIKTNIADYFKDTTQRCFIIENVETENTPKLNAIAKKVITFYNKAVAANFDLNNSTILDPSDEALATLENEGRLLELEVLGKIGNYWFPVKSAYDDVSPEEMPESKSILQCSLEIKRAMALVAPKVVKMNEDGSAPAESEFTVKIKDKTETRLRISATGYAAMVVDYWFGEAGIEEILGSNGSRAESLSGYFKDIWQTGIVRALRYKKENDSYGLGWYEGNVSRADSEFDLAVHFENEQGKNPFEEHQQWDPSVVFIKKSEELLKLAKEYLEASRQ